MRGTMEGRRKGAEKSAEVRRGKKAKKNLEQGKILAEIQQQIFRSAHKLINSQKVVAEGYYKMITITKVGGVITTRTIHDQETFDDLLENGEIGKDYHIVAAAAPDAKAANMLLDRGVGKAVETLDIGSKDGKPLIIRLDT